MSLQVAVRRLAVSVTTAAGLAALGSLLHAQAAPVNNPPVTPRSILVFPQRDFVSASGFGAGEVVTVEVFHPGSTTPVSHADVDPQDDPATPDFDGIVEVNHPGGACWQGVTPDIRPGDRVRTTRKAADTLGGVSVGTVLGIDETTVANVTAKRPSEAGPGVIEVRGTAVAADGRTPIDITQLEQRLVVPRDRFDVNGRRTLRATSTPGASDGLLTYDGTGSKNWTATYTGLQPADMTRAVEAESRIMWLGSNPGAGVEATVYEVGAGIVAGPAAPCTAPLEVLPPPPGTEATPPSVPTGLTATVTQTAPSTIRLAWAPSTDNVGVTSYGIYRNGVAIANVDGVPPAPTTFDDVNVPPGTYTYTVDAADAAGNRSAQSAAVQATAELQRAAAMDPCGATPSPACVSEPPNAAPEQVQIIAFPARDFTSASGYLQTDTLAVQVIRNGYLISTATVIPIDDDTTPGFDGIVEVNHPGGACWQGTTPDLRVGDIVRHIAYGPDGAVRRVDQTHVANISVQRPIMVRAASSTTVADGVVQVHGTAMDANGAPIALDQIEQRLVAGRERFLVNGRRTLRAPGDGEFSYDTTDNADGIKFTATYSGLTQADVDLALRSESRILFLGQPPLVAPEITIYENSDLTESGPAAGFCTAPLEPLDTQPPSPAPVLATPTNIAANTIQLTWTASSDNAYVNGYGIYRDGLRIRNVSGTVTTYIDANVPAGDHTYAVDAVDSASPLKVNYPAAFQGPNTADPILQGVEWGNRSAKSNEATVTQHDVLAPSVPTNLVGIVQGGSVQLTWTESTDDVAVTSYRVYRTNGTVTATFDVARPPFTDSTVATGATYTYSVDAADAAGNRSAQSASVTVVVTAIADKTAPSQPTGLVADTRDLYSGTAAPAIGPRDVKLSWTAATDNVGVAGYGIYRRPAKAYNATAAFVKIADVNGSTLTFTDRNVAAGTYDYTIDAVDSAGNRSGQASAALNVVTIDDPPQGSHSIIPFPARDFVSSSGYAVSEGPITITVIRGGKVWARSTPVDVVADPATPGIGAAEVNHPGGGCWDPANGGITPDLRPGDIVRFTNRFGKADQTTTANVWADRATDRAIDGSLLPGGTIQVHGTAQNALGNPLPIDQVESRLVASSATLFSNGHRTLRAAGDGTIAYDPVDATTNPKGINWTATFAGLSATDIDLAKAAESRAVWLGRDPLALTELTIFENGDGVAGGPAAGTCTAPAEAGPAVAFEETAPIAASFDPGVLAMTFPDQKTGTPADQTLTVTNLGSADAARAITGELSIASAGVDFARDFTLTTNTCTGATVVLNNTCTVIVRFNPTTPGFHTAKLLFKDNANNSPVQVIALGGNAIDGQAPTVTAPTHTFAVAAATSVPNVVSNTVKLTVTATASDPSGVASMTLEQTTDGRTWKPMSSTFAANAATNSGVVTATIDAALTATWQFRATATDGMGNKSAPVASPSFRMTLVDDSSGTPRFQGSWSTDKASSGSVASTVHWANAPQVGKTNTVTYTFTGSEVAFVSTVGSDRGQLSVSLDGGATNTVDLYRSGTTKSAVVYTASGLTTGSHTITLTQNSGAAKAPSTGTRVDVDAFIVK